MKHYFGLGLFNPESLFGIWSGYLRHSTLMSRWLAIPTLLLLAVGSFALLKRHGLRSLPLLLAPPLLIYSLSLNFMLSPIPWNFAGRRHLDYIWPLVVVPLGLGALWVWRRASTSSRRLAVLGFPLVSIAYVLSVFVVGIDRTQSLAAEYSWNNRNIEEVSVAMGRWIAENTTEGSSIGVTDAGAMRFFGGRETIDLLGLNFHPAIGRRIDELIREYRPDYAFLFRSDEIDNWPFLVELYHIEPERNTILGGGDLVAYRVDFDR